MPPPYDNDEMFEDRYGIVTDTDREFSVSEAVIQNFSISVEHSDDGPRIKLERKHELSRSMSPTFSESTVEGWLYNEMKSLVGDERTAKIYAGNVNSSAGWDAVRHEYFNHVAEKLTEQLERGEHPIGAFNVVTSRAPDRLRDVFAGYELAESDRSEYDDYERKVREYAESVGTDNYELMQTTLDCFYPENPYDADDLSEQEADIIFLLRAEYDSDGRIDYDILDEIEDYDAFSAWLNKTGSAETALRAHKFDSSVPEFIATKAAAPSEWPDGMDPQDIDERNCVECGTTYYKLVTPDGDVSWTSNSQHGSVRSVRDATSEDGEWYCWDDDLRNPGVCESCVESFGDRSAEVVCIDETNTVVTGRVGSRLRQDLSGSPDVSAFSAFNELPDDFLDDIRGVARHRPDGYIAFTPSRAPTVSEAENQRRVLADAETDSDVIEELFGADGRIIISKSNGIGSSDYNIYVPDDSPPAARAAKEFLEEAGDSGTEVLP